MRAWISRLIRRRRTWLFLGVPVCVLLATLSVASVSLVPPKVSGKGLGYATAGMDLYVGPRGGLVNNQPIDVTNNLIVQAYALADQMSSPQIRSLIASRAGIAASKLAVDGPLDLNESLFLTFPDGEKRSSQIIVQNVPYRVTIDEDTALPEISVTAQAPTPSEAVRLASATQAAASAYLAGIETRSRTPVAVRLGVSPLGPIAVSDDSTKGLANLAVLTFLVAFALWSGLVVTIMTVARDVRRVRRGWTPDHVSP
jgi:hypothetical protein